MSLEVPSIFAIRFAVCAAPLVNACS